MINLLLPAHLTGQKPYPCPKSADVAFGVPDRAFQSVEKYVANQLGVNNFLIHLNKSTVMTRKNGVARIFCVENVAFISYARELSVAEALFPIAHELGHLVLHLISVLEKYGDNEKELSRKTEVTRPDEFAAMLGNNEPMQKTHWDEKSRAQYSEIEASYFAVKFLGKCYGYKKAIKFIYKAPKPRAFIWTLFSARPLFSFFWEEVNEKRVKKTVDAILPKNL